MSQTCSMKQIGARVMNCTVEHMEWNNKMDLIAYSSAKGEVIIQRLNWQNVTTFPSPGENIAVRSLSWQLDTTILAVGYSNGKVSLLDAEREDVISCLSYGEDVQKVYFSKAINKPDYRKCYHNRIEHSHDFFLPHLPFLNGIDSSSKSIGDHRYCSKYPSFLVVTLISGKVHILILGALKAGIINLAEHVLHADDFAVHDVRLSGDFNAIYALVRDGSELKILHFHNKILQKYTSPMLHLTEHSANILQSINYINDTIHCMLEAWETVILEMDNKLTKYANQQTEGSLTADFLELLVFGYATHEIEEFLMDDLTEKGLKKLANSVELSYSSIQNLVTKPLQSAAVSMFYFLNTIKGLSKVSYYFEPLISTTAADNALRLCGAFIMKILELQQVIDQCVNDMKLFFCWLGIVIVRLHQQDVTEDMTQLAAEDTIYLAEYLNSFEDSIGEKDGGTVTKRKFNLEKVGQYFEDKNLTQVAKTDIHHLWNKLLEENECLRNCPLLYPYEKSSSLIQQRNKLLDAIDEVFKKPNQSISENFKLNTSIRCCTLSNVALKSIENQNFVHSSYYVNDTEQCDVMVTTIGWQETLILEFDHKFTMVKCLRVQLAPGPFTSKHNSTLENLRFVDLQFYNENIISMLLQSDGDKIQSHFVQFTLDTTKHKCTQHILPNNLSLLDITVAHSIHDMIDGANIKSIDGECTDLAVSGSRKVVTLLSEFRKKITIFEMEIEDDEDDTEMSQNSILELSKEPVFSN